MNPLAKFASLVTLGLVIIPCGLYWAGVLSLEAVKWNALVGTIGWFIATPLWMSRRLAVDARQVEI